MITRLIILFVVFTQITYSQQYDSVIIEKEDIDSNNQIYKPGNVFVYDYEIIQEGSKCKLDINKGMFSGIEFDLIPVDNTMINIEKIHLLVKPVKDDDRTNENQTQISYLQEPIFETFSSTGVVENEHNVWIHPFRSGFFNSLETCPFPYIQKPIKIGLEWQDKMKIGQGWSNPIWGEWEDSLLLDYQYKITGKEKIETEIGEIDCFVIESTATSNIGKTALKSYYSNLYGFVRLEYSLINDLQINFWLVDFKRNKEFNDVKTFFQTKEYIKS